MYVFTRHQWWKRSPLSWDMSSPSWSMRRERMSLPNHSYWLASENLLILVSVVCFFFAVKIHGKICKTITSNLKKLGEGDYSHALNSNLLIYFTLRRRNISKNSFPHFQKNLYIYFKCLRNLICTPNTNTVSKIVPKLFKFAAHDPPWTFLISLQWF